MRIMGETENDYVDKAEEERLGIIAKYDKGREEGAQIDPWEDPTYEIYHATDHYGFIHDTRFPREFNAEENKQRKLEADRADKWAKMRQSWEKYKNSDKLRKRVFKGIPNKVRSVFWGELLDLPNIKEQQKGKYEEMYLLARKYSMDVRQVDLDVNRTYRDNLAFRERYGVKQQSLFNILIAYSVYNSEVGYCQGMSQVAAMLLLYMDEEDAFWGLSQLMTHHKYGMHGLFIAGFPKLVRYQKHHDKVLKTMMPKLKKHFDKYQVDVGLYTLKWFFQCFLDRVPFELALRLWDIFIMDGDKVLICGAYTILKIHQKQLLARKSMDDLLDYIQSKIPATVSIDNDTAIEVYQKCVEELHRKKLDSAGDDTEEELPKKPFGLIENLAKPVPVRRDPIIPLKNKKPIQKSVTPPAEEDTIEATDCRREDEDSDENSEKVSVSRISMTVTSAASSSIANSPHNFSRPVSSVSNFSYASAIEDYNTSNKSTPVKMNGVSGKKTNKHAATDGDANMNALIESSKVQEHLDQCVRNGSVENLESVDYKQSIIVNISGSMKEIVEAESTSSKKHSSHIVREKGRRSPNPPPPPPRALDTSYAATGSKLMDEEDSGNSNYRGSIIEAVAKSRRPISPKNPRSSPGSIVSSSTEASSYSHNWSSTTTTNIPGGEAVRIHVPYSNSPTHHHDISTTQVPKPVSASSRTSFDVLKNDPNRIKIDISLK